MVETEGKVGGVRFDRGVVRTLDAGRSASGWGYATSWRNYLFNNPNNPSDNMQRPPTLPFTPVCTYIYSRLGGFGLDSRCICAREENVGSKLGVGGCWRDWKRGLGCGLSVVPATPHLYSFTLGGHSLNKRRSLAQP